MIVDFTQLFKSKQNDTVDSSPDSVSATTAALSARDNAKEESGKLRQLILSKMDTTAPMTS